MSMPKEIYMRDDGDEGIELTSDIDRMASKYVLSTAADNPADTTTTLCARIQSAAIKCDTMHVFVSYSPHVASLTVYARCPDTNYLDDDDKTPPLMSPIVAYLDLSSAEDTLNRIIYELGKLGVEV